MKLELNKLKHLALFNGIGGFQLAADWMGWENVAHVEIDAWCNKVVKQHFPKSKCYTDIKEFDGKEYEGTIDIITGGFPCQPFSVTGQRKGKEDARHLWPEMFRVITEIRPTWIVGENVTGIIGLALEQVLYDLESAGYNTETFIIPACAIGALHKRDRLWIIAYSESARLPEGRIQIRNEPAKPKSFNNSYFTDWRNWANKPIVGGRVHGIPNRVDRIKGLGNAIVPQVALEIFRALNKTLVCAEV